jgi:hypothetical protein
MLNLLGAILGLIAVTVNVVAITTILPLSLRQRLALAGILGAWTGLASGLGAAGLLEFATDRPVPLVGVLFATPLLVVGALAVAYPSIRRGLLSIPTPVLIGLNSMRLFGVLFLMLAAVGRLSGPFPFSAGFGDIITGAIAIPLAFTVARGGPLPRPTIARWNLFGALDLVAAIGLGLTSANGSPAQLFHVGVGSGAMQQLPYSLVPTVLVPFYLITHALVAAQLVAARRNARAQTASAAIETGLQPGSVRA